jgi:hypothetical protein
MTPLAQEFEYRGADRTETAFDGDVRMRAAAENLQRERLVNAPISLFEEKRVFHFRAGDAAGAPCQNYTPIAILRLFLAPRQLRVVECKECARDRELRVSNQAA